MLLIASRSFEPMMSAKRASGRHKGAILVVTERATFNISGLSQGASPIDHSSALESIFLPIKSQTDDRFNQTSRLKGDDRVLSCLGEYFCLSEVCLQTIVSAPGW